MNRAHYCFICGTMTDNYSEDERGERTPCCWGCYNRAAQRSVVGVMPPPQLRRMRAKEPFTVGIPDLPVIPQPYREAHRAGA